MSSELDSESLFRIEEMSVAELIQHKYLTFHKRVSENETVCEGGDIYVKITSSYLQRFTEFARAVFKSPLQLEIWLDGCQSAKIHCEGTVMVITVSAHPKYSCLLELTGLKYTLTSDITRIRVKEEI